MDSPNRSSASSRFGSFGSREMTTSIREGCSLAASVAARTASYWSLPIGDPGPFGLFATQVYNRGAGTLHALRVKIGDDAFFAVAKEWVVRFGGGTATTADFIALSEEISGQDLGSFFQVWAYDPPKPTSW